MKFSELQYEELRLWWNSTAKLFALLDLPAELREAIYLQIIAPVVVPDVYKLGFKSIDEIAGHKAASAEEAKSYSRIAAPWHEVVANKPNVACSHSVHTNKSTEGSV